MHNRVKVLIKEYASGNVILDATPHLVQASWTFKRHGGIESFYVSLAMDDPGLQGLTAPIVELWMARIDSAGETPIADWDMVAAGPAVRMYPLYSPGQNPMLTIECVGYLQQLKWATFAATYDEDDIDTIIEDIIDTQIASDVDITRHTGKTTAGSGTQHYRFEWDGYAYDAIMHCAEILGNVEWGVMPFEISGTWYPAKFYFVASSSTVTQHYFASDMLNIDYEYNLERVRNNLVLRGDIQEDDGDVLDTTEEDATSQTTYGKRTEIIHNPFIDNATDAGTYLQALENVLKNPGRGLAFMTKNNDHSDRLELNVPMGAIRVWDLFTDVNSRDWYVNSITYTVQRDGSLDMDINAGDKLGVRQIYPPSQRGQSGAGGMKLLPFYGRGGYNKALNPNWHLIDWSRRGPGGWYYPKEWWKQREERDE